MYQETVANLVDNKNILITGGTGSFGKEILKELSQYHPNLIRVFSRGEKKQYDMQQIFKDRHIQWIIGDVRDYHRVRESTRDINLIFHAAALKQVPSCEYAPSEAVLTNINGAENIRRAAIDEGVEAVIGISTDKAVKPINVMGISKAMQERIFLQSNIMPKTRFICVRYGNVLGSRGSIVPLFVKAIQAGKPLPITHIDMTRFQLTLNQAVQLVFLAGALGKAGELWVRKMPSAKIIDIGRILGRELSGKEDYPIELIGIRPGEKMHEVLISEEEMWYAQEKEDYFVLPNKLNLAENSCSPASKPLAYSSDTVHLMDDHEIYSLLQRDGWLNQSNIGV